MKAVHARAFGRAGLLGNPSDQFLGKALALSVDAFAAEVWIEPAAEFRIVRGADDALEFASFAAGVRSLEELGCYDGVRLLRAALRRFALQWPGCQALPAGDPRLRFALRYTTNIPRQAGLAGSSAIVIATLRALATWFGVTWTPFALSERALEAETDDLGIAAGPMDRAIQSHEGLLAMDFGSARRPESYRRLDPALLPPLFLAYDPRVGTASGVVHRDMRARWLAGDPELLAAIATFRALVDEGIACLERRDHAGFRRCMDQNFDTRARLWTIAPRGRELVEIGRACGAAVKFCGSGGSVVGSPREPGSLARVLRAYEERGYRAVALSPSGPA